MTWGGGTDARGVTAVVGFVLLIAVVMAGVGAILIFGGSATEEVREQTQVQAAVDSMSEVSVQVESSAGASRNVDVGMPNWADQTKVVPDHSTVTFTLNGNPQCRTQVRLGAVKYLQHDKEGTDAVTYVAGGIFQVSNGEATLNSPPALRYDDHRVAFEAQLLRGERVSRHLDGKRLIEKSRETELDKREALLTDGSPGGPTPCAPRDTLTIEVESPYHEAWYDFLREEMQEEGTATVTHDAGDERVVVEFLDENDLNFDSDDDGVYDRNDNCPATANPAQRNTDEALANGSSPHYDPSNLDVDPRGDACDPDDDGDGITDRNDRCMKQPVPGLSGRHGDMDGDELGDACDPDPEGDGYHRPLDDVDGDGQMEFGAIEIEEDRLGDDPSVSIPAPNQYYQAQYSPAAFFGEDNCPANPHVSNKNYNPDQVNTDDDEWGGYQSTNGGNVCDQDDDGDGIDDGPDDCPTDKEDLDGFLDGDGCPGNDEDNDGVIDENDECEDEDEEDGYWSDGDGCYDPEPADDDDDDGGSDDDGDDSDDGDDGYDPDDGGDGDDGGDDDNECWGLGCTHQTENPNPDPQPDVGGVSDTNEEETVLRDGWAVAEAQTDAYSDRNYGDDEDDEDDSGSVNDDSGGSTCMCFGVFSVDEDAMPTEPVTDDSGDGPDVTRAPLGGGSLPGASAAVTAATGAGLSVGAAGTQPSCVPGDTDPDPDRMPDSVVGSGCYPTPLPDWETLDRPIPHSNAIELVVEIVDFGA